MFFGIFLRCREKTKSAIVPIVTNKHVNIFEYFSFMVTLINSVFFFIQSEGYLNILYTYIFQEHVFIFWFLVDTTFFTCLQEELREMHAIKRIDWGHFSAFNLVHFKCFSFFNFASFLSTRATDILLIYH